MAVVVTTAVTSDGGREIHGLDVGNSEDEVFWRGFFRTLKERVCAGPPARCHLPQDQTADGCCESRGPCLHPGGRINRKIQRCARVVGIHPNEAVSSAWLAPSSTISTTSGESPTAATPPKAPLPRSNSVRDIEVVAAIEADD